MIRLLLALLLIATPVMGEEDLWVVKESGCNYIQEELSNEKGEVLAIWEYSEDQSCDQTIYFKGRLQIAWEESL